MYKNRKNEQAIMEKKISLSCHNKCIKSHQAILQNISSTIKINTLSQVNLHVSIENISFSQ